MPNNTVSHVHNTAPGPPETIAVATPMMLPVPMVDASAVVKAANGLISPSVLSGVTDNLIPLKTQRCTPRVRIVIHRCVPKSRRINGGPHNIALN